MKTKVIVSSGQYESAAIEVIINHTTDIGLNRRITQLSRQYAVYGDNWAGWINAKVAIASESDEWKDNSIIGGKSCQPTNGWIDPENKFVHAYKKDGVNKYEYRPRDGVVNYK